MSCVEQTHQLTFTSVRKAYFELEFSLHPLRYRDKTPQEQLDCAKKLQQAQEAVDRLYGYKVGIDWPGDDDYGWTREAIEALEKAVAAEEQEKEEQRLKDEGKGKGKEVADSQADNDDVDDFDAETWKIYAVMQKMNSEVDVDKVTVEWALRESKGDIDLAVKNLNSNFTKST